MHIMLDLETMGNGSNAAIVSIGAVGFTFEGVTEHYFEAFIDLESSVNSGGVLDAGTVVWWMKQEEAARKIIYGGGLPIKDALSMLETWFFKLGKDNIEGVWGNGSDFDNVILGNAYHRLGVKAPWKYSKNRCYRTLKNLYGRLATFERTGTHHSALDDARSQAVHCAAVLKRVQGIITAKGTVLS